MFGSPIGKLEARADHGGGRQMYCMSAPSPWTSSESPLTATVGPLSIIFRLIYSSCPCNFGIPFSQKKKKKLWHPVRTARVIFS